LPSKCCLEESWPNRIDFLLVMLREHPKSYWIRTYGCQMNELDSEMMRGVLERRGLFRAQTEQEADLLIFNTCSIRDLAERKVLGKIGQLNKAGYRPLIGVTGCMAVAKREALFKKLPSIDFILGTNNIADLDEVLDALVQGHPLPIRVDSRFREDLDYLIAKRDDRVKAYVSIIRGCNKACTYCVVPHTRGKEVSRPPKSVLEESLHLRDQGYKEITLLGQNVNSYGKDRPEWNCRFHDLLYQLDKIQGLERIRFMTSHPVDISLELMQALRDLPSLCEFVHFPLQAGSNRILRKMHRIYTKEAYLAQVASLRSLVPNVALGTDIIVGFPTETEEEFQETYDLYRQIRFSVGFLFAYSRRKQTPAHRWLDDVPQNVKAERLKSLLALHEKISSQELQRWMGKEAEVLVEEALPEEGLLKGRTRCWKKVIFPGSLNLLGSLQTIRIEGLSHQTLQGRLLTQASNR